MKIPTWSVVASIAVVVSLSAISASAATGYTQTNLVSDLSGAATIDLNLVNPWGMASSASSPIWVSDNGTGVSTLYNGAGTPQALVVTIPGSNAGAQGAPTGVVFNGTSDFGGAHFIFATENGTIDAWAAGTSAVVMVDHSASGTTVYKGLAIGNNGGGNFLYATNFHAGTVEVFNASFAPTTLAGTFTDPGLPAGYAPFGIQNIGGILYVTYAVQDAAKHDDVAGPGSGFVNRFDLNGNFLGRLISNGPLNSPWGLALAPANFGDLSNSLLVGNFGDGTINAFSATTGAFMGTMRNSGGAKIVVQGLWGLLFGNGGNGGAANALYFTAGIPGPDAIEDHGLFGNFTPIVNLPIPTLNQWGLVVLTLGLSAAAYLTRRRKMRER